ncbi:MAG: hypothetical protein ACAI34_08455 [Verrucomicrobium sp.]
MNCTPLPSRRSWLVKGTAFALGLTLGTGFSQDASYPEVEKFAANIKDTTWELRGTYGLKRLRYDGKAFAPVNRSGQGGGLYETAFVDVGVVRLNFRGANSGWYFFSDDLKYLTSTTISAEIVYKLSDTCKPKPVKNFPADIEGQVWDSVKDERNIRPSRFRWNGKELEVGTLLDQAWDLQKHAIDIAERRVIEIVSPNGEPTWYVFSADGKEAWMLHVEGIFGGYDGKKISPVTNRTPAETGLTAQQTELSNFGEDLVKVPAESVRLASIRRQMARMLRKQPELAQATRLRLGGK